MIKKVKEHEFFNEISKGIVVVDFFADWCEPCKRISPVIDEISEEMADKAKFIKVDVEECSNIADKYEIDMIPSIVIFKDGELQEFIEGILSKETIIQQIQQYK